MIYEVTLKRPSDIASLQFSFGNSDEAFKFMEEAMFQAKDLTMTATMQIEREDK